MKTTFIDSWKRAYSARLNHFYNRVKPVDFSNIENIKNPYTKGK